MARTRAAVVGAGVMGAGIAELLALAGCDVVLQSRRAEARSRFLEAVARQYRRAVARGRMPPAGMRAGLGRVRATGSFEGFDDREIVIEAVAEEAVAKSEVLRNVDRICPPGAVIASTTSSFTIEELAAAVSCPERFVGTHFFNPVRFVRVVEVVRTRRTAREYVTRAETFVRTIGKTPLRVRDGVGFLVNRVLIPSLFEGCRLYTEHAATPWEIDQDCIKWGMLIGPCAMLDIVGLDTALAICRNYERAFGAAYRPPAILQRCVAAGRLGRKSGRGIYAYPRGRPEIDPELDEIRGDIERLYGAPPPTRYVVERLIVPMINESVACLAEGVATADQINLAMREAIGMARGPLEYYRDLGSDSYFEMLEALVREFGDRFAMRPELGAFLAGEIAVAPRPEV